MSSVFLNIPNWRSGRFLLIFLKFMASMVLQHWNDVHIAVEISRVEKKSNQGNSTLHIPGCTALLKESLGETDISEN